MMVPSIGEVMSRTRGLARTLFEGALLDFHIGFRLMKIGHGLINIGLRGILFRVERRGAQAQLELARAHGTRTQALYAKQNSAQADVDQAMANLHQAEANVKIKQGALDKVRADFEHCTITSPIDGTIISRSVDVGQTVAASLSAPILFTIAQDLAKMQIDANAG